MQLRAIAPFSETDKYNVDIIRRDTSIVLDALYADLLIDYHLELRFFLRGAFKKPKTTPYARLLISQYITNSQTVPEIREPSVLLEMNQHLDAIRVNEDTGEVCVYIYVAEGPIPAEADSDLHSWFSLRVLRNIELGTT